MTELTLADGIAALPRAEWNALVADDSPFLEWEWLASLEETGCVGAKSGWLPRPLVARRGGRLVAACPLYVKAHSEGEFVFDFSWADAAERAGVAYYPKLLVGVPFTPVPGARVLAAPGEDRRVWLGRMAHGLRDLCGRSELSSVHVNFCRPDERDALVAAGFLPRVGFQYHWHNAGYRDFEDYLGRLRARRRNQVRRERRTVREAGVEIQVREGADVPDDWLGIMYGFYRVTVDTNPWGRRYLTRELFDRLAERFRHRLCLVMARQDGEWIAGALNVVKGDTLYGRYWGATRTVRHLHFEVCYYAGIEHAIRRGLARFEPGAGGEYKQIRGFDATPTWSAHWLEDPGLRRAVARTLEAERAEAQHAIAWLREHSALKPAAKGATPAGGRPNSAGEPDGSAEAARPGAPGAGAEVGEPG